MNSYWIQFQRLPWDRRVFIMVIVLSLPMVLLSQLTTSHEVSASDTSDRLPHGLADTHIPNGFVLIPIEVQNYEALDSILGPFGVVDLFQTSQGSGHQRLVARNVRILRAPQNPSHFAVLVPEREAANTLSFGGPFTVIIKRPHSVGTEFVKEDPKNRRSIIYGEG